MAASLGFEPRQRDPESLVLPLHYEARRRGGKSKTASMIRKRVDEVINPTANYFAGTAASSKISSPSRAPSISSDLPLFLAKARACSIIRSIMASS